VIFRATYDDDGMVTGATADSFALEHIWGITELQEGQGIHLKATKQRVTVTASGYVATYEIVKQTKHEVETRLLGVRRIKA
jgi:hypothetical protein